MNLEDEEVVAQQEFIRREIRKASGNMVDQFVYATYISAEGVDANLSVIQLSGEGAPQARFVPKGAHVTGLSAGNLLLCVKPKSGPLTILCRVVGDISLASA